MNVIALRRASGVSGVATADWGSFAMSGGIESEVGVGVMIGGVTG